MEPKRGVCASCPHLAVDRDVRGWPIQGKAGHCRLRDFPVENWEETACANHPERNVLKFEVPVGPIWIADLPTSLGGFPVEEEGVGETCGRCGRASPGPKEIIWRKRPSLLTIWKV